MRFPWPPHRVVFLLLLGLGSCASKYELTAVQLDKSHPQYESPACRERMAAGEVHKDLKLGRMLVSPALVALSGGLLLPILAVNTGLDIADHVDSSNMADLCGGRGQNNAEIASEVAAGAALGLAVGLPAK
jgi:hypothetical protein